MILLVLIVCFFIFLYNLFLVSRDDFTIAREDISMNKLFNLAFAGAFFSLISARFSYVLFNKDPKLFSLIGFLAITYFPGLSLIGGILGSLVFIYGYCTFKKLPTGKIADLFTRAFLGVLPIGFLLILITSFGKTSLIFNILFICSFIISFLFIKPLFLLSERGEIKDGSYTLIFVAVFTFVYFLIKLFTDIRNFYFFNFENIILFVSIFASLMILINQEIIERMLEKR